MRVLLRLIHFLTSRNLCLSVLPVALETAFVPAPSDSACRDHGGAEGEGCWGEANQYLSAVGSGYTCVVKKHSGTELCISHIAEICRMSPLRCVGLLMSGAHPIEKAVNIVMLKFPSFRPVNAFDISGLCLRGVDC